MVAIWINFKERIYKIQLKEGKKSDRIEEKIREYSQNAYPPPMVIIEASAAINSSEPCPRFLSLSMPTQGYFARSGYNENKNVSPVPK